MKDEEIKLEEIEVGELQELLRTVRVLKFFRCTRIHTQFTIHKIIAPRPFVSHRLVVLATGDKFKSERTRT